MKLKSYIALLLAVLVLSAPYMAVGQNFSHHTTSSKSCCDSKTNKNETSKKSEQKDSKDCCKKNACICAISISTVAFVQPTIAVVNSSHSFFLEKNAVDFYLDKILNPATAAIWQPPKF